MSDHVTGPTTASPVASVPRHAQVAPDKPVFSRAAVVASCVGFVLIGALQALYGPAIPAFREEFGLSPSAAGLGLSAHFVGGVAGSFSSTGCTGGSATGRSSVPRTC